MASEPKVTRKRRLEEETIEQGSDFDADLDNANVIHEKETVTVEKEVPDDDDTVIIEE